MKKLDSQNQADDVNDLSQIDKKPYQAPAVLSVERLEAAAVTCDPPETPFGKTVGGLGSPCSTLGS